MQVLRPTPVASQQSGAKLCADRRDDAFVIDWWTAVLMLLRSVLLCHIFSFFFLPCIVILTVVVVNLHVSEAFFQPIMRCDPLVRLCAGDCWLDVSLALGPCFRNTPLSIYVHERHLLLRLD